MKLNASTQNAFDLDAMFPGIPSWEKGAGRRPRHRIKPFDLESGRPTLADRDALARKQEVICAVILVLCLLFTLVHSMTQFSSL